MSFKTLLFYTALATSALLPSPAYSQEKTKLEVKAGTGTIYNFGPGNLEEIAKRELLDLSKRADAEDEFRVYKSGQDVIMEDIGYEEQLMNTKFRFSGDDVKAEEEVVMCHVHLDIMPHYKEAFSNYLAMHKDEWASKKSELIEGYINKLKILYMSVPLTKDVTSLRQVEKALPNNHCKEIIASNGQYPGIFEMSLNPLDSYEDLYKKFHEGASFQDFMKLAEQKGIKFTPSEKPRIFPEEQIRKDINKLADEFIAVQTANN